MRHLATRYRNFRAVGRRMPYKTRCGLVRADLGTAIPGSDLCPRCFTAGAKGDDHPGDQFSIDQAVNVARMSMDRGGLLGQHAYQALASRLSPMDRHEFTIALRDQQIRVRTGAINIVDDPDQGSTPGNVGDPLFSGVGTMPGELNDDLDGATTTLFNKPMRTEGDKEACPSGWNLEDLTMDASLVSRTASYKVSPEAMIELLNEGLGLEYSQAIRYRFYAETILGHVRDSLANEFLAHAGDEDEHAAWLARRLVVLGGTLDFRVDRPTLIDPQASDAVQQVLEEVHRWEQRGIEFYVRLRDASGEDPMRHLVEEILVSELEHLDDLARLAGVLHKYAQLGPADDNLRWNESYSDENDFEGLERMGKRRASRVTSWRRRADAVKRTTQCGEIPVHIEWNAGETRKGEGPNGPWERVMAADYGFIPDTVGSDNEPIDVYLGGSPQSRNVYVVNQMRDDGGFDEEKVMLGFSSPEVAEATYRSHYPNNGAKHFGGMYPMSMDEFLAEFVRKPSDAMYIPKLELRQVEKDADHGPGDADGCGGPGATPAPTPAAPTPAPKAPAMAPKPPAKAPVKGPSNVDSSPVKSPAEMVMSRDPGRAKQFHDQFWRLLGGPGMNPWASKTAEAAEDPFLDDLSTDHVVSVAMEARAALGDPLSPAGGDSYDSGMGGPLGNPDPPSDVIQRDHA